MTRNEAILWTKKLASGIYSQEELNVFLDYMRNASEEEREEVLTAYHKNLGEEPAYLLQVGAGFMDRLRSLKPSAEPDTTSSPKRMFMTPWSKISVAAACIISLTLSIYWLFFDRHTHSLDVASSESESIWAMPERNKAMLTLADGTTIMLDAAVQGNVPGQAGVKIIKIDSALLSYQDNATKKSGEQPLVFNTISVPVGGQYQLILADGSHVWLNSASSLRFPAAFTAKDRKVALNGEAYFEVAKDASKPFIVETGSMQVRVLGTHFNVMAYADEGAIKTTLIEGSVKLSNNNHQTLIRPGQQGTLLPGNTETFAVNDANIEEVIAWKEGRFRFDEMNIKPIMRQISRWYDVDIVYEGDMSGIALSGSVPRKENVVQLLKALEMSGSVRFEMKGNKIVVKPFTNQN